MSLIFENAMNINKFDFWTYPFTPFQGEGGQPLTKISSWGGRGGYFRPPTPYPHRLNSCMIVQQASNLSCISFQMNLIGPMTVQQNGRTISIGVTSFGKGCGDPNYPGEKLIFVQICQNLLKLVETCQNLSKLVKTQKNQLKLFFKIKSAREINLFKLFKTYSFLS